MNQKCRNFYADYTVQQNQSFLHNRQLVNKNVLNFSLGFKRLYHPPFWKDRIKHKKIHKESRYDMPAYWTSVQKVLPPDQWFNIRHYSNHMLHACHSPSPTFVKCHTLFCIFQRNNQHLPKKTKGDGSKPEYTPTEISWFYVKEKMTVEKCMELVYARQECNEAEAMNVSCSVKQQDFRHNYKNKWPLDTPKHVV